MKPDEIRSEYLRFFERHDHRVVSSSPVVPQGDPTLLFTNAGMNQFKDLLLGNEKRDYTRAASSQKCIRAGGKHNDLDEVGRDGRHLTFFEMLGNWSFGDYYKRESILWAWEFITEVLKIDQSRLYVTVYKDDDFSYDVWANEVGFPTDRIARQGNVEEGDEENFWSMGDTGPCGPCTEIHYDLHPEHGPFTFAQNAYDEDRVMEFWNLVFMEFNRTEDGTFLPLPIKSVDTGMGLERMAIMQAGVDNVFQTELFSPILEKIASLLDIDLPDGARSLYDREDFTTYCIIADHIRSVTFALSDGATFSNEGRGSVLRSILRRAVRHGRQLGFEGPFMYQVAEAVINHYGDVYPELRTVSSQTRELIRLDEERFFRTIDRGIVLFEKAAAEASTRVDRKLTGEEVFELHATYGFPPDLTRVMAEENNLEVDLTGYASAWQEHQAVSRGKNLYAGVTGVEDWITVHEGSSSTFTGYTKTHGESLIRRYRLLEENGIEVLLAETPFYAESGGQVGDQGILLSKDGSIEITIHDTQKTPIGIVHQGKITHGMLNDKALQEPFITEVNRERRSLIMSNHTATHLLHAALRDIVSEQIFQAGSLVAPEKLRFDFSHGQPLTREELRQIEDRVNAQIRHGYEVTIHEDVERDVAIQELGAMAIFGEKYDDHVRVVDIPGESVELCGGTHVKNTSDINLFRITHESGVAAGIRRIEAVTNEAAYQTFQLDTGMLEEVNRILKSESHNLLERARNLTEERAQLERQVRQLAQQLAQLRSVDLVKEAIEVNGVKIIAESIGKIDDRDQLLAYADKLRERLDEAVVLLGAEVDGKPALLCMVTESVFKTRKIKAGDLINKAAVHVAGKGGGRPTLAQAGGSIVEGLPRAIESFEAIAREALA